MNNPHFLPEEEFLSIYAKVPRLTIDTVITSPEGVVLALRSIQPYYGLWHVPGGTLYKDERIEDAAVRIAKNETGLDTTFAGYLGCMEFPGEVRSGVTLHTISIVVHLKMLGGTLRADEHASDIRFFNTIPKNMEPIQEKFMREHTLLG